MKKPSPKPLLSKLVPRPANDQRAVDALAGQIQTLATRLEALRAQGAGQTAEFRALEQMLQMVQDKLLMAEARLKR